MVLKLRAWGPFPPEGFTALEKRTRDCSHLLVLNQAASPQASVRAAKFLGCNGGLCLPQYESFQVEMLQLMLPDALLQNNVAEPVVKRDGDLLCSISGRQRE